MNTIRSMAAIALMMGAAMTQAADSLSAREQAAAFKAAGFAQRDGQWRSECDDPGTPSYTPGNIESVADLNGDGQPEAVITEGGTYCYGMAGTAFVLVSRQANGRWVRMSSGVGMPMVLNTRGKNNWPDVQVGGPGFCFPVLRWDGREYKRHRFEYEGKRCQPSR